MCESRARKQASQWNVLIGPFYFHFNKTSLPSLPLPQLCTLSPLLLASRPAPWTRRRPPLPPRPPPLMNRLTVSFAAAAAMEEEGLRQWRRVLSSRTQRKCRAGRKEEVAREIKVGGRDMKGEAGRGERKSWDSSNTMSVGKLGSLYDQVPVVGSCHHYCLWRNVTEQIARVQTKLVWACVRFVIKRRILASYLSTVGFLVATFQCCEHQRGGFPSSSWQIFTQ